MPSPRVLLSRPTVALGLWETVLFVVWTGPAPRAEDVTASVAAGLPQAKALRRCALIVAVHPKMPLPEAAVRQTVQTEMRRLDPYLVAGATVLGREGLSGTAMRAVISTMQLLSRPTHPEKIVASSREAAAFIAIALARQSTSAPSADAIAEAYDAFTKQFWSATKV